MSGTVAAWLFLAWFVTIILAGVVGAWVAWPMGHDRGYEEGLGDRHRHRHGDPQVTTLLELELPQAGRLEAAPALEAWVFAGGWDEGPAGSAEYELLTQPAPLCPCGNTDLRTCQISPCAAPVPLDDLPHQTAELPVSVTGEPPIDTGELLAITDRVESWIAQWTAQGNYDRHTMRAD